MTKEIYFSNAIQMQWSQGIPDEDLSLMDLEICIAHLKIEHENLYVPGDKWPSSSRRNEEKLKSKTFRVDAENADRVNKKICRYWTLEHEINAHNANCLVFSGHQTNGWLKRKIEVENRNESFITS